MINYEVWKRTIQHAADDLGVDILWCEHIRPGDLYLAYNNTGPHLLTCKEHNGSFVVPVENAYCFNTHKCVKVVERVE